MWRLRSLFVICAGVALLTAASTASAQGVENGVLEFQITVDEDSDGDFVPAVCSVVVYHRFDGRLPNGSRDPRDLPAPVASEETERNGTARIELPPGLYTLRRNCDADLYTLYTDPSAHGRLVSSNCCPAVKSSPRHRVIYNEHDDPVLLVQDVEIKAGEVTHASFAASSIEPASRRERLFTLAIAGGLIVGGATLVSIWKFRPRYDPKSDPKNPKRLTPREPDKRPAGFDEVFGDFLEKR